MVNTSPPINDNCVDALLLEVGEVDCVFETFSSQSATIEPGIPSSSCTFLPGVDVWFKFEVPSTGLMQVDLNAVGGGQYTGAIYSGECGALQQLYCLLNNGAVNINNAQLAGETLYLRVYRTGDSVGGLFELCAGPIDCVADLNFDGIINSGDLGLFLGQLGCVGPCLGDLNFDGVVNSSDLGIFLAQFGELCD